MLVTQPESYFNSLCYISAVWCCRTQLTPVNYLVHQLVHFEKGLVNRDIGSTDLASYIRAEFHV